MSTTRPVRGGARGSGSLSGPDVRRSRGPGTVVNRNFWPQTRWLDRSFRGCRRRTRRAGGDRSRTGCGGERGGVCVRVSKMVPGFVLVTFSTYFTPSSPGPSLGSPRPTSHPLLTSSLPPLYPFPSLAFPFLCVPFRPLWSSPVPGLPSPSHRPGSLPPSHLHPSLPREPKIRLGKPTVRTRSGPTLHPNGGDGTGDPSRFSFPDPGDRSPVSPEGGSFSEVKVSGPPDSGGGPPTP